METYDAIVVGGGITGAAIAYELQKLGQKVLLVEKSPRPINATALSYGGIPYWAGRTAVQQQLCHESRYCWSHLTQELGGETEYREMDLILYARPEESLETLKAQFKECLIPPQYVDTLTAIALEPQFNPQAIQGAFVVAQGHIHTGKTVQAYTTAFTRLGGTQRFTPVTRLLTHGDRLQGIETPTGRIASSQVILAAGAFSRSLLQPLGLTFPLYFTQALVLQTPPVSPRLRCIIMPADWHQRPALEALAPSLDWSDSAPPTVAGSICEPGAVQFLNGQIFLGQISQLVPSLAYHPDLQAAQTQLHQAIAPLLPALADLPSTCYHYPVAFNPHVLPLVGEVSQCAGLALFTGFTFPLVYGPPLARRLAQVLTGKSDPLLTTLNPSLSPIA